MSYRSWSLTISATYGSIYHMWLLWHISILLKKLNCCYSIFREKRRDQGVEGQVGDVEKIEEKKGRTRTAPISEDGNKRWEGKARGLEGERHTPIHPSYTCTSNTSFWRTGCTEDIHVYTVVIANWLNNTICSMNIIFIGVLFYIASNQQCSSHWRYLHTDVRLELGTH